MTIPDPVMFAKALIREESVTPAGPAVFNVLETALTDAGFEVERMTFAERGAGAVENLFATAGGEGTHLALAGHVDVVPPGEAAAWTHAPFDGAIEGDTLFGRGAQDMKGAVAAMVSAAAAWRADGGPGRVSFLITGDEEGPAINGTRPLADWCAERLPFDVSLVGEPTSRAVLGDTIKVGRRGSLSCVVTVSGVQGHVAYQHKALNPIPALLAIGTALNAPIDDGSAEFAPSNLEIASIDVGNPAFNVIPAEATLRFNVRFNDHWSMGSLKEMLALRIEGVVGTEGQNGPRVAIEWQDGASDVFLTRNDDLIERVQAAVEATTGVRPEATTGGGTSDARFLKDHGPVVEFGAVGSTMHQVNERTSISELRTLAAAYRAIIERVLAP